MTRSTFLLPVACAAFLFSPFNPNAPAAELLLNGNFESPVQATLGDHLGVAPSNWTTAYSDIISLNNPNNLVRGTILGTGTTSSLAPYPGDTANGDLQSFDGNGGDVFLAQTFTPTASGPVQVSVAFGGRDAGSNTGTGSSWQILDGLGLVVLASGATVNPATGSWAATTGIPPISLIAGTPYTFRISLANADMVDAASIQTVPEPSAWVALALAAGICVVARARRRSCV